MKPIQWLYQLRNSREWQTTDSATLLFRLIPSGNVAAYRVHPDSISKRGAAR